MVLPYHNSTQSPCPGTALWYHQTEKGKWKRRKGKGKKFFTHSLYSTHSKSSRIGYMTVSKMLTSSSPERSPHPHSIVSDPFLGFLSINAHVQVCLKNAFKCQHWFIPTCLDILFWAEVRTLPHLSSVSEKSSRTVARSMGLNSASYTFLPPASLSHLYNGRRHNLMACVFEETEAHNKEYNFKYDTYWCLLLLTDLMLVLNRRVDL